MNFSEEFNIVTKESRNTAIELGWNYISSYHFLIAMYKSNNLPSKILKNKTIKISVLTESLKKKKSDSVNDKYFLTKELETSIKNAKYYSWTYGASEIEPEHVTFAMLADNKSEAGNYLKSNGINYSEFRADYQNLKKLNPNRLLEYIGKSNFLMQIGIPKMIYRIVKYVA